jgi:hypothetical protein
MKYLKNLKTALPFAALLCVAALFFAGCDNPTEGGEPAPQGPAPQEPAGGGDELLWSPANYVSDYTNDLWFYLPADVAVTGSQAELAVGGEFYIRSRHMPEIVATGVSGPDSIRYTPFRYQLVSGDSVTVEEKLVIDEITGTERNDGLVWAVKPGVSVIHVTYDSATISTIFWPAISPVNTGVVIVNVLDEGSGGPAFVTNIEEKHRRYDKIYTAADAAGFTFSVTCPYGFVEVKVDGLTRTGSNGPGKDGTFTAPTRMGYTIVEVSATNAAGTTRRFYTLKTRRVTVDVANSSRPGEPLKAGDTARVTWTGLTLPVYKLSAIYNPWNRAIAEGFGETATIDDTRVRYDFEGETLGSKFVRQYAIDGTTLDIELDRSGTYTFTNGRIVEYWWGRPLGDDDLFPDKPYQGIAPTGGGEFCTLPEFSFTVLP